MTISAFIISISLSVRFLSILLLSIVSGFTQNMHGYFWSNFIIFPLVIPSIYNRNNLPMLNAEARMKILHFNYRKTCSPYDYLFPILAIKLH